MLASHRPWCHEGASPTLLFVINNLESHAKLQKIWKRIILANGLAGERAVVGLFRERNIVGSRSTGFFARLL